MDNANSLVFVGFGFGEENLDLIAPTDNQGPTKAIYATRFGTNDRRWGNLEAALLRRLSPSTVPGKQSARQEIYGPGRIFNVVSGESLQSGVVRRETAAAGDFRPSVLKGVLRDHLGIPAAELSAKVFPDSIGVLPMDGLVG